MTTDNKYNGWTNYETWCVSMWIDNDQGSQEYWQGRAEEIYQVAEGDGTFTRSEHAAFDLAEELKDCHEQSDPLSDQSGVFSDLLTGALSAVNWHEIALSILESSDIVNEDHELVEVQL